MAKIEEIVEQLVKNKIETMGYTLYDVLYLKEGQNKILRVVIDSEKGISLEDCEKVNNEIKDIIDKEDLISEQYFFEVSSPGIERTLRKDWQLKMFIGEMVEIKLFKKNSENQKSQTGILKEVTADYLKLNNDIIIDRKNIAQVKTIYID